MNCIDFMQANMAGPKVYTRHTFILVKMQAMLSKLKINRGWQFKSLRMRRSQGNDHLIGIISDTSRIK